jgi:cytochrome P450
MILYPDVQRKAQSELGDVIQGFRLVDYLDKKHLPYTVAVMKEVLRWQPLMPTAVPHMTMRDDKFDGYFIPAGSFVFGNAWYV